MKIEMAHVMKELERNAHRERYAYDMYELLKEIQPSVEETYRDKIRELFAQIDVEE